MVLHEFVIQYDDIKHKKFTANLDEFVIFNVILQNEIQQSIFKALLIIAKLQFIPWDQCLNVFFSSIGRFTSSFSRNSKWTACCLLLCVSQLIPFLYEYAQEYCHWSMNLFAENCFEINLTTFCWWIIRLIFWFVVCFDSFVLESNSSYAFCCYAHFVVQVFNSPICCVWKRCVILDTNTCTHRRMRKFRQNEALRNARPLCWLMCLLWANALTLRKSMSEMMAKKRKEANI